MIEPHRPDLGRTRAAGPFRIREIAYPAGFRQARHAHECASVTLVLSGVIHETAGTIEETAASLSVVVKPPHVEHSDAVGRAGSRTLQVVFDGRYALELGDSGNGLGPWRWLHAPPAVRPMLRLVRLLRRPDPAPADDLEDAVLAVLAGVTDRGAHHAGSAPAWIRRVREELDDRPADNLRVRDLADRAGVHPVSLARAFRRWYGTSVTEYRKRQRVRLAARAIDEDGGPLGRIAYAAGYADQPHLCRHFREATGLTPSEFRRLSDHR